MWYVITLGSPPQYPNRHEWVGLWDFPYRLVSSTIRHWYASSAPWPGRAQEPAPDSTSSANPLMNAREFTWASRSLFSGISSPTRFARASRM